MNERVMKAAIEYIASECSANIQMLECNPRTAITIAECQRLMVGFSAQQSSIKEQTTKYSPMSSIDNDKKKLHDSLRLIAHEDPLKLLLDLGEELYHRREMCKGAYEAKMEYSDLALAQLKYQNDRIIKLLGL